MDWFRSWHGAPTDTKWLLISRKSGAPAGVVAALAWALMDHASRNGETRGGVSCFDLEEYAAFSCFDLDQLTAVFAAMTEGKKPFIDRATMTLTGWDKHQSKQSDNSTDRVRAYRSKTKRMKQNETDETDETVSVTQGNTEKTRPDPDQKDLTDPRPVTTTPREAPPQGGSGSFPREGSGVGSDRVGQAVAAGFDIRDRFTDSDWDEVSLAMRDCVHPAWDRKEVFGKYNAFAGSSPPRKPKAAFIAWLRKNRSWLGRTP